MNNKIKKIFYILLIFVFIAGFMSGNIMESINTKTKISLEVEKTNAIKNELNENKKLLNEAQAEIEKLKLDINSEVEKYIELEEQYYKTKQELQDAMDKISYLDKQNGVHNGWAMCWRDVNLEQWEIDFFAKLLHCEAGIMSHEGQFWVASAILNLSEVKQMSIWEMGHNVNIFSVAPWVDDAIPDQQQYDIIYEVLNNGWIANVAHFRTNHPHSFGTFMIEIDNIYFSTP